MRIIKIAIMLSVIIILGNLVTAYEKIAPEIIDPNVQIVSDELQIILNEKSLSYKDSMWPRNLDKAKVDKSLVPKKVMLETTKWLKMMIKDKYLPEDPNTWLIPIRKPKPGFYRLEKDPNGNQKKIHIEEEGFDDYLIMRYSVGQNMFQIQEGGSAIRLLIDVNDLNILNLDTERFITNTIYEFLNYPEDKKNSLKFNLKNFTYNQKTIYFGTINCDYKPSDVVARSKRTWWNQTFVWTDGKRVYFGMVEMDGKPQGGRGGRAKPGITPRFKKK